MPEAGGASHALLTTHTDDYLNPPLLRRDPSVEDPRACADLCSTTMRKTALFTDDHHNGIQRHNADEDLFQLYGVHYRIPPLFDQMHADPTCSWLPAGGASYAQIARAMRGPPAASADAQKATGRPNPQKAPKERAEAVTIQNEALPLPDSAPGSKALVDDRDEIDRWRRSWSVVVRRDILRQQRALVTQQREMVVTQKRTALAVQKEVRKRALRAQRLASNPQVQVRCKRIARDLITLTPALETKNNARRLAAEHANHELANQTHRRPLSVTSADTPEWAQGGASQRCASAPGSAPLSCTDGGTPDVEMGAPATAAASDARGPTLSAAERCLLSMLTAAAHRGAQGGAHAGANGVDERIPTHLLPLLVQAVRAARGPKGPIGGCGAFAMVTTAEAATSGSAPSLPSLSVAGGVLPVSVPALVRDLMHAHEPIVEAEAAGQMKVEVRDAKAAELSELSRLLWPMGEETEAHDVHRMWTGKLDAQTILLDEARRQVVPAGGEHSWRAAFVPRAVAAPPRL